MGGAYCELMCMFKVVDCILCHIVCQHIVYKQLYMHMYCQVANPYANRWKYVVFLISFDLLVLFYFYA